MLPLQQEIERLSRELISASAVAAFRDGAGDQPVMSPGEKGRAFEDELVLQLQGWKKHSRAAVEHVGADNRPGDLVVTPAVPVSFGAQAAAGAAKPEKPAQQAVQAEQAEEQAERWQIVIEAKDLQSDRLGRQRIAAIMRR